MGSHEIYPAVIYLLGPIACVLTLYKIYSPLKILPIHIHITTSAKNLDFIIKQQPADNDTLGEFVINLLGKLHI